MILDNKIQCFAAYILLNIYAISYHFYPILISGAIAGFRGQLQRLPKVPQPVHGHGGLPALWPKHVQGRERDLRKHTAEEEHLSDHQHHPQSLRMMMVMMVVE